MLRDGTKMATRNVGKKCWKEMAMRNGDEVSGREKVTTRTDKSGYDKMQGEMMNGNGDEKC